MSHGALSLFLSLLLSFHLEAGSGKLKAVIQVTQRSAGIKVPERFMLVISDFMLFLPHKCNAMYL